MNQSVYIIVLNWNGKDLTLDCLESLTKVLYGNYKIIVVDNGSIDDSVSAIKLKYPNVDILRIDSNIGYAAGNNAGFEFIKNKNNDYVIFLNNDTIVDENFIEPLVRPLINKSEVGQTVPKIFYANDKNRIWYAGGKVNKWLGLVYHNGIRKKDSIKYSESQSTDYATGCCFCTRYKDFEEIGGFDTSFPMYGEDVDLSLRIRSYEKNILYAPNSIIWHKVSASVGGELSILKIKRKILGLIKIFNKHTNFLQKITIGISWIISIPYQLLKFVYLIIKKLKMIQQLIIRLQRIRVNLRRFGIINTIKYLVKNVIVKRPVNQINYYLKRKKYPQNIIFITSLPKSGSTWLSNMCAGLDGFDLFAPMKWNTYISTKWDDSRWDLDTDTFKEFINKLAVVRGHTWALPNNIDVLGQTELKYLIGVRDPRDKLISEYWHSRNFPGHWAHELAHEQTIEEFISYKLESGEFEKETLNWIRNWLKKRDKKKSIIIRYEDLLIDPKVVLEKIFMFLDFKIEQKKIENIIAKYSFDKITGRKRGKSDDTKFVRKGVSGEWKTIFSKEQKLLFSKIGEDVIKKIEYKPTF